jgi:hypothetical protein
MDHNKPDNNMDLGYCKLKGLEGRNTLALQLAEYPCPSTSILVI